MSSTGHLSELDLLRSQVADLSRELAERDRVTQNLREQSDLLRAIVEGTAAETGEEFFASLVTHLTAALHIQYAVIGEVQGDRIKKMRTLAVSAGGVLVDNFEYDLPHTPCATALTQAFTCFNQDLQATFPGFQRLVELGAESYCAVPVRTKEGAVRGLLVVMDTKPLQHGGDLQSLLEIFAQRVGAEFERSRVEQERARVLAEINNVIKTVPDIMFTLDAHGNMVRWNWRVENVTGYSPEELLNMPALAFVPPEEHITCATAIERAFTEGYAEFEGHLLTRDHRLIPYHWTGALLKNSHGEPIGITGIGRDVSDKKQAEEALHRSEERLVLAVEGSNDILWDAIRLSGEPWYAPQTPIWWSPRVRELLDLEESESFETLEQWAARLHPDDKDRIFGQLAAHIEHRVPYDVEYRLCTNQGDYLWIRGRGQALWDEQGEPLRMSGSCQDITERKQAEEALRASEAKFRMLVEATTDWMWEIDAQGRYTYCSPKIRDLLGYEPDEALGKTPFDFMPEEEARRIAGLFGPIAAARQSFAGIENTNRHKDGRLVVLECRGVPIIGADGVFTGYRGFDQDITDRKQAEESFRASEERWQLAVRGSNDGIWDWDIQAGTVFFSPRWKAMRGFGEDEITSHVREWQSRIHSEDLGRVLQSLAAYLAKQTPEFCEEYRTQRKDGSYIWILDRGVALWAEDGTALRMVGSESDITDHKLDLLRLAEQESLLRAILDAEPECVNRVADDGTILQMNRAGLCFFESDSFEQVVGRSVFDLVAHEFLERYRRMHEAVIRGTSQRLEFQIIGLRGTRRWMETHAVPLRNPIDHRMEHLAITRDVTDRKQAEEALCASEERLRLSLEAANQGIYDLNVQTGEALVSPGYVTMLGYDPATFQETSAAWIERLHPDDRERVADFYRAYVAGEIPEYRVEFRQRTRGGDWLWILSLGRIVERDASGEPLRMLGTHTDITERKQAEEALRISEERFDLAVRGSNTGIWDWDLRTSKTYFSPLWKSMLGYGEHELKGEFFEWEERLHPDDRDRSSATVRAYLVGTTSQYELEHRLRHKDGSFRWILARGVSICDTEGKPYRMAGSHIDITELKETQEALAQRERQLQTVLDALPVGVWFTDGAGRVLLANPAAKQIWSNIKQIGLQTENPQTGWWESIGPVNEPHRWALSHVLTTGVPSQDETFDFECLDGTKKTIRNSTVPVISEDGVILGAIVLNEDITQLRQAQAALQLTQFSVDHAVEGFLWIASDARIFHINDAACRMLDYTREELTAMTLYDIDPKLSSEVWPAHWEELKQKGSLTFESKYWSRTGRVLDMEVTVNYLQYEGKEYNCAIMRDISERKQAEEALRASEGRYRSLYDDTPIMYFTLATDGTMRSVNRFGAEQLGYQVEELIGHSVLGLFHESDREAVAASLSECLATPETTRYWEFRKLRKDGSMIWVREAARVGRSDTEETVVLVTCEDITERKQAEHESRERTRQVLAMQAARLEIAHLDDTRRTFFEVLSQVTRIVANTLAVERVSLWLLSEDQTELVCQDLYLRSQATHSAGSRLAASSYPRYLAVLKESLVIGASNARVDQRTSEFADDYFFALGITSVLDVPIRRQGKLVGVLWCEHVGMPREWAFEAQDFGASVGQTIVRMMEASERTQAEDRLRATQYAVDHATDYIFVIGSNGYFLDVNKSACRRLGYTKDELLTKSVMDIDPDFPPAVWESFWEEIKHKKLLCLESRHRSKSGETYPVEVIANYILHEGKELDYAFVRDITERKRAEKELQKSYSFLRQVIDLDPNFIFAKDREGRFTLANKAVADAYGTTAENLIGKTDSDFNPNQEEVAFFRQDDLAVIDTLHELFLPEEVITDSDGRTRWLQTVKRPILDDEGCAIMVLGSSTDITERKSIEETLRQRERDLQAALHDRERISQDLHDGILQSLFAVGLSLEVAKSMMTASVRRQAGQPLDQAINQLNYVMREIRNFIAGLGSDLLRGKDLTMVLKQMLASLTENQATNVRLVIEDQAAKALSTEQSLHLIRVIQEAVSNCIRHSHASEAMVSLKILKRAVRLNIRDNGRGFDQTNVRKTGHGLRNMASRAQKIGGKFSILSKMNEGTSIVIDLPREAADVRR